MITDSVALLWQMLRRMERSGAVDGLAQLGRQAKATDATAELLLYFEHGRLRHDVADAAFNRIAHRLRAPRILFVPSVPGDLGKGMLSAGLMPYLAYQVRQLRDEGFDADLLQPDAQATVAANARAIGDELRSAHRPTWLVTHSKGGLDALEGLLTVPEAQRFIEGWVAFQTPFFGTPVADAACGKCGAGASSAAALRVFAGTMSSACDLCTDVRQRYMDERAGAIAQIAGRVPIMCVGTRQPATRLATGRQLDRLGLCNDGVVPLGSTVLPGSRFAVLPGLAHGELATRHLFSLRGFEHVDLLKVLLTLLIEGRQDIRRTAA